MSVYPERSRRSLLKLNIFPLHFPKPVPYLSEEYFSMNQSSPHLPSTIYHLPSILRPRGLALPVVSKVEPSDPPAGGESKGFTLIEVMITIIIIGILSTLGISMFQSTQKKSRDMNRKASLIAVTKALEQYMSDKGQYPPSSPDGKILWCGTSDNPDFVPCSWGGSFIDVASAGDEQTVYLAALPKDQVSGQTYFYEAVPIDGLNKGYLLYARLENEKDPDIPLLDGNPSHYSTNCSTDTTVRNCNYVLTSETVSKPTP